ncbi:unnamed protein product [Protopolystoma xenopodis]|uniref:Uncharacterized protein n=1 Tax=Protopolystoma xenopodis TaxID=117903 RepID=A0A3S5AEX6_9PLAT|nr:unnamed protein product [Protopolystoma xenopodis]
MAAWAWVHSSLGIRTLREVYPLLPGLEPPSDCLASFGIAHLAEFVCIIGFRQSGAVTLLHLAKCWHLASAPSSIVCLTSQFLEEHSSAPSLCLRLSLRVASSPLVTTFNNTLSLTANH